MLSRDESRRPVTMDRVFINWFTVPLAREPAEAYEKGAGVSIRGARLIVVSSRPGMLEWATETARERQMECTTVAAVDEAVARVREDARLEWCALH